LTILGLAASSEFSGAKKSVLAITGEDKSFKCDFLKRALLPVLAYRELSVPVV
jgi:hypothetical protein